MFFRILVALSLLLPPQQAPPTGRSAPAIPHAQGEHVTVSGVPLWVESEGRGEPLLLISGGPGASHNYFHPGFTQLADAFRVIYFDAFGRGRSARAASPAQYTFDRDVRDIEALRVALGLGRIHVLGHSYGGMVALAYAKAHPEAVRSLTLANAPLSGAAWQEFNENFNATLRNQYPEAWAKVEALRAKGLRSSDPEHQAAFNVSPPAMMFLFDGSNGARLRAVIDETFSNEDVYYAIAGHDADFVLGDAMRKLDFREAVGALQMPVLVLAGRFDREVFPRHTLEYRRYAPKAQFVMFERSGHFPFLEEPELTFATLRAFLSRAQHDK